MNLSSKEIEEGVKNHTIFYSGFGLGYATLSEISASNSNPVKKHQLSFYRDTVCFKPRRNK